MVKLETIKADSKKWPLYGELGILAYDAIEDKVQCHICGRWFRGLNNHVLRSHGWTANDYREEFGLNKGQSLICEGTRQKLRDVNLALGNWKYLLSQTLTKDELREFLRSVKLDPGYTLRTQAILMKSERLREYNPMNEPEAQDRALARLRETWYGTPLMRALSRRIIAATIKKLREKNLERRRWTCPCGEVFPIRKDGEHHRRNCPVARAIKIAAQVEARRIWWENLPSERRELFRKHVSEGKKRRYAERRLAER